MILIALGANLPSRFGSPEQTLKEAMAALTRQGLIVRGSSSVWVSAPVPASDQPWYRNAVVSVECAHDPIEIFHILKAIEKDFGRVDRERNAARVLDLDLIAYHQKIIETDALIVPHPRMRQRDFVLKPLRQVAPDWIDPLTGQSVDALLDALPDGGAALLMDDAA